MKTVIVISDPHSGHKGGLTSDQWFRPVDTQAGQLQRELRRYYDGWVAEYYRPDVLLVLGDCIDGKGKASGGTELLTSDRDLQSGMAVELIEKWDADTIKMVYGTPYHAGKDEDWESVIAERLDAEIHGQMFVTVEGVTFHIKHKVGGSTIPHGRHTATARDRLWLAIWEEEQGWPTANVVLRGHVHYHQYCGGPDWLGMTSPALCAAATKYGSRQCSGIVHFGIVVFKVDGTSYDWHAHTVKIKTSRPAHAVIE